MSLLTATNLSKRFDRIVAVDGLSLNVHSGEILGLLGPNGAGKTTTMSMLSGLLSPDAGSVVIDGHPFQAGDLQRRKLLGIVPQDLAIYPDLTAIENLRFFGQLYELRGSTLQQRIEHALQQTGLAQHANRLVTTFSGGMKRRLNFAVALLHQPRLLILDEPTVGVDPQSRAHLLESIRRLRDEGLAVVYASHYMEEVEAICDRVTIIDHGRAVASGRLDELLAELHVDLFLRIANVADDLGQRISAALPPAATCELHRGNSHCADAESTVVIKTDGDAGRPSLNDLFGCVLEVLDACQAELRSVETSDANLERLFLRLTGHRLRD